MLCQLLHRHQHRQQHHARVLFCEELAADGVRELLHAPCLTRAGIGAEEHALRLVRALRSPGRRREQQRRQLRHLRDAAPAVAADAVEASAAGGALAALRRDVDELRAHRAEAVSSEAEARGARSAFAVWVGARAPGL